MCVCVYLLGLCSLFIVTLLFSPLGTIVPGAAMRKFVFVFQHCSYDRLFTASHALFFSSGNRFNNFTLHKEKLFDFPQLKNYSHSTVSYAACIRASPSLPLAGFLYCFRGIEWNCLTPVNTRRSLHVLITATSNSLTHENEHVFPHPGEPCVCCF